MTYSIIPKPFLIKKGVGNFKFSSEIVICSLTELKNLGLDIVEWVKQLFGYNVKIIKHFSERSNSINLTLDSKIEPVNEEGYILEITSSNINIKGKSEKGVFYGIQSLKQILLEIKSNNSEQIPCGYIKDYPRFTWRGIMLDSGRHFHPISTIKKLLDIMALLKMNVFHWHLTEDQGWRIEIKKYPKLTEIGSKRKNSNVSYFIERNFTGKPHEGFFTQDEIKEIVEYAFERFIKIIPEIELPGHSVAAIASYPELSCTGKQIEVATDRGIFSDIYCAGKESTFTFLQDVLDEVVALFPSDIIHIGGDEVPKKEWKNCPNCQNRIVEENLMNEEELQEYFTNRIGKYLKSKGKQFMGWNEILGDTLDISAICQWWIGKKKTKLKHLRRGRNMVISNRFQTYLNLKYEISPLRFFYNWDPIPNKLEKKYHKFIKGVEAPLWTEPINSYEKLGKHVFPRIFATAEVVWTQKELKNYFGFKHRISTLFTYLDIIDMPYSSILEADPSNWDRYKKSKNILMLFGMYVYFAIKGFDIK